MRTGMQSKLTNYKVSDAESQLNKQIIEHPNIKDVIIKFEDGKTTIINFKDGTVKSETP